MRKLTLLATFTLAFAALAAFAGYIGYFGGPVFVDVAATGSPDPRDAGRSALLLSGDMGSRVGMEPRIAARLAEHGIPVVQVNSLSYFRQRRSPAEVQALIREGVERTIALAHGGKVILIGQSFGADMLHVGLPVLPAHLRRKVALVALVVPGNTVDFRASPAELLTFQRGDAAAMATARLLNWVPVLCVQGVLETNSLCPLLRMPNVRRIALPGGHPMHYDADRLYAVLASAIRQPGEGG